MNQPSEPRTDAREVVSEALRRQEKLIRSLEGRLERQDRALTEITKELTRLRRDLGGKGIQGAIARVDRAVSAVLRRLYVEPQSLPAPHDLMVERFGIASQNEEDGLTLAIFRRIGIARNSFVDIGCGGNGGNSGFLAQECGWSGLMIDGDDFQYMAAVRWFAGPDVTVIQRMVDRDNVNAILREHGAVGEIDLLSIDIDGNDYWVWEALEACSPRLVIVEYNAEFGRDRALVVPYDPQFNRHNFHRHYYGASLAAFTHLAEQKGYRLITTEPSGVNAYFLRNDVGPDIPACTPEQGYRRRYQYFQVPPTGKEHVFAAIERKGWPLTEL